MKLTTNILLEVLAAGALFQSTALAEVWTQDQVLGPTSPAFPFAGIYQFDNLTIGDGVEVTSSNLSQLIIKVDGALVVGAGAAIRVRNGYYAAAPTVSIASITLDNLERLGNGGPGFHLYPGTFGRGGDGGAGGPGSWYESTGDGVRYCSSSGGGGGGGCGCGGGLPGAAGFQFPCGLGPPYPATPGFDGDGGFGGLPFGTRLDPFEGFWVFVFGDEGGWPTFGGYCWKVSDLGTDGQAGDGGGGGGGNGGNGGGGEGYGGGGGGYGGGVLTIIANEIIYDSAHPPRFLVSGQKGGAPNGQNGEGGLLLFQCPNYIASTGHWDLGTNTFGQHTLPSTNGGHGIVTGGPQKVFFMGPTSAPPSIVEHPQSQTICAYRSATFSVEVDGTLPFAYQWQFNGLDLPGKTNAVLTLDNVWTNDAGAYRVVVANRYGTATSEVATLTVVACPPIIVTPPQSQTARLGTDATLCVVADGSPPLTYQWWFNGAEVPDATNDCLSLPQVTLSQAGDYVVVVSNLFGSVTSAPPARLEVNPLWVEVAGGPFSLQVHGLPGSNCVIEASNDLLHWTPIAFQPLPGSGVWSLTDPAAAYLPRRFYRAGGSGPPQDSAPAITRSPASQSVSVGDTVTFVVEATGYPVPAYQWFHNDVAIPGATNPAFTLSKVQARDAGNYTAIASNRLGSATSAVAVLTVATGPEPKADYRFNSIWGSSVGTPPALAPIGTGHTFGQQLVDGAMQSTLTWPAGRGLRLQPTAGVCPNNQYTVALLFKFETVSSLRRLLDFKRGSSNNGLYVENGKLRFLPFTATSPTCVAVRTWHQLVMTRDATGQVRVYCDGVLRLSFADTAGHGIISNSELRFFKDDGPQDAAGSVARIRVWASALSATEVAELERGVPITVPEIVTQPQDIAVGVGGDAVFSVSATSPVPLSYQWQWSHEGTILPGATGARLVLTDLELGDAGTYSVRVTNAAGSAEADATLTVSTVWLSVAGREPSGAFRLTIHSPPGTACELLASTNVTAPLADWAVIAQLTNTTGAVSYTDPVTNLPRRFYRLRELP